MSELFNKHKNLWTQKYLLLNLLVSLVMLFASLTTTYYANYYTFINAGNSVTDLLLDNLPVVNVNFIFNEGAFIFIAIGIGIILYEPKRIVFTIKSVSMFMFIRSIFMVLTHIAPPVTMPKPDTNDLIYKISSGNDLFFSAHTGLPFMMAVIFWHHKNLRAFFLFSSFVGATSVILGHLHYSIDVFSAFFISFGIFHISKWLFKKDYELLMSEDIKTS